MKTCFLFSLCLLQFPFPGCRQAHVAEHAVVEDRQEQADPFVFETEAKLDGPLSEVSSDSLKEIIELASKTDEWTETGEGYSILRNADFELGCLVPCRDELAEFELEVTAVHSDKSFYSRKQSFCFHVGDQTDPAEEPGMNREHVVCAMLVNGFASGYFHYTKLGPKTVSAKIDWSVSQLKNKQSFNGEVECVVGESGTVSAGGGNEFVWAFNKK